MKDQKGTGRKDKSKGRKKMLNREERNTGEAK